MRRPSADERDVKMADILCDFCGMPWTDDRPMVEGHRGSCLCSRCLSVAYTDVVLNNGGDRPRPLPKGWTAADVIPGAPPDAPVVGEGADGGGRRYEPCCLCLTTDAASPHWRSPLADAAGADNDPHRHKLVCRTCLTLAASAMGRDRDAGWSKPTR